ncbi:hypothetical protein AMATHDRAFT_134750 [Amanita thiersii Skay4041]|uniref:Uncharacterized protein n=1 Tax=Amanita thiersii Skay4041 TaxID=703135 RepID=A0A2A9P1F3_9AGAR|nr:hypothetical protein AMATHDRAFT_134750 [Amanita thiersii Skay4041]
MDFVQRLDPFKLLLMETVLSFCMTLSSSPPYNFPLFLFGFYVQENAEAAQSLQIFTALLGASALFDLVWLFSNTHNGFVTFMTTILFLVKIPMFFAFASAVRMRRGSTFGSFGGFDTAGATVWSMPGGFTSGERDGYQTVDDERPSPHGINNPRTKPQNPPVQAAQPIPPGAYQV